MTGSIGNDGPGCAWTPIPIGERRSSGQPGGPIHGQGVTALHMASQTFSRGQPDVM